MTCSCSLRRAAYQQRSNDQIEVTGTWDFKWPLGKKVRVAFQHPQSEEVSKQEFEETRYRISELANRWTNPSNADISFDWSDIVLEPADDTDPLNGSPFDPPRDPEAFRQRDYDVLVSLDPLPRGRRDPITLDSLEKIFLPTSELGAFSRRLDYGVPTMYIGPFTGIQQSLKDHYAASALGAFYVVHEFGHALGLAHAHQSPVRRSSTLTPAIKTLVERVHRLMTDIREDRAKERYNEGELRKQLRVEIDPIKERLRNFLHTNRIPLTIDESRLDEFVVTQIVEDWPGNVAFSDWSGAAGPSIMEAPCFGCILGLHPTKNGTFCQACLAPLGAAAPTAADQAQLQQMYPKLR